MSELSTIAYFGYGSLVNLATLQTPYISAHRARLTGWRRRWLAQPRVVNGYAPVDGLAFLSVEPDPATTIEGIVILDHRASLLSLDQREALYQRVLLPRSCLDFLDDDPLHSGSQAFLYRAQQPDADQNARILRSYLDAVMQGYLEHFGENGVRNFITTTDNFQCPIHEDREAPLYPRPVSLGDDEKLMFSSLNLNLDLKL